MNGNFGNGIMDSAEGVNRSLADFFTFFVYIFSFISAMFKNLGA